MVICYASAGEGRGNKRMIGRLVSETSWSRRGRGGRGGGGQGLMHILFSSAA